MSKALGIVSGGLDSTLAARVLMDQGVEVTALTFETPFFGADKGRAAAAALGIPHIVMNISEVHLEMLKNPKYGYGKNLNPCIDCHALMFRLAAQVMDEQGFDFLFSGEVLGQRPMSQNRSALQAVAKHAGCSDKILRPLSALLLPPTPMEEQGLVDRSRLLDIQGRSRKRQQELAKQWGITDYPASGGGCLLTEKSFTERLRDMLENIPDATVIDVELLKAGRQFRLSPAAKLVVGRNRANNDTIQELARPQDVLVRAKDFSGPLGLVSGTPSPADLETAAAIIAAYGKGQDEPSVEVLLFHGEERRTLWTVPMDRTRMDELVIP